MSWYWSPELGRNVLNPAKIVIEKAAPRKNQKKPIKKLQIQKKYYNKNPPHI
jgi:hypothetical protein